MTKDMDRPTTTTISTIAISAGKQATIVVALLKSVGYACLRIDEMRPRMLDLGENAEETNALQAIHVDLMQRLKSKEDQVEELLSRADNLVAQQKEPDVHVYEAMAESLGAAWKELNRQLQMRGFLLTETVRFYELAKRHERLCSEVRNMLRLTMQQTGGVDLNDTMQRVQQLINELIDVTALAVDSGADVITQVRVLGAMADNVESSQETVQACLLIEKIMLKMAAEWELLEESWKNERSKLEMQIDESGTILAHIEEIENWLRETRMKLRDAQDINILMQQALKQRKALKDIISMIEQSTTNANLHGRALQLQNDLCALIQEIKVAKDENDKVIAWIAAANTMLNQLKAMETDMRNANAAMAGELAPLARQKAQTVVEDGRRIAGTDQRINRLISEIENKLKQIEELARERIDASKGLLNEQFYRFEKWLVETEQLLAVNGVLGSNLSEAKQFHTTHKNIVTEIINKGTELNALWSKAHEFTESDRQRLQEFRRHYESLKERVDERVNLGGAFQQVHKFAKELESSFESLDALISSNRAFSNEKLLAQMKEVFRMIEETIRQEKHQGEKFIQTARSASEKDSRLSTEQSVNSVRNIINEHEQKYIIINENWQRWQESRIEEQKIIRVVEEVQMWQEETIEIIRTIEEKLGSAKVIEEYEEVKRTVEEIIQRLPEQMQKLEEAEHISKQTEGEEAYEKVRMAKKKHKEIEERLVQLRERISMEERTSYRETITTKSELTKAPEIISHLRDAQIDEGNRFEFAARVEGQPTPEIHWYKDGRDVKDNIDYRTAFVNGVASLTIDETFVEDTAVYTVRAENSAGLAESSAKLVVKSRSEMGSQLEEQIKPRFIRQLRNVSVTEGEDALLDCVLVGVPEPKVVWYKEEEIIKESEHIELRFEGDHCSLKVKSARINDSGLYTLKASNIMGETTNFCRLTVQPPVLTKTTAAPPLTLPKPKFISVTPSFAPPLVNQIIQEGERVVFQVRVFGEPAPTVYWKFNDKPLYPTANIRIEEEINGWCRVTIENAQPEQSGMYTVIAENEAGEARSGATLNVEPRRMLSEQREITVVQSRSEGFWSDSAIMSSPTPPPVPKHRYHSEYEEYTEIGCSPTATVPEFIRPFQNEYLVTEGEKFKMDCLMIGNPRPKVHWYFNDRLININSKFCTLSNIGDTYSVVLEPARLDHAGVYKMTAENIRGKTESVFVVHVRPQSLKPTTLEHVRVTEEYGAYEYEQRIPDQRTLQQTSHLNGDLKMYEEEQRRLAAKQHSTRLLTPPPAKKQQLQTMHSQQQHLLEHYDLEESRRLGQPPHFTQTLVSAVAACGDEARFEGIVTGWPTPEVTWTKDGIPVSKATNPELSFSNIGGRVSLSFPAAQLEHAGKYMCTAKNASGVATSSAQLVVRPRTIAPDFVRRLISEEVAEGEKLKWTVQVTGDPVPKVTWIRDGQIIPNCDEVCLIDEGNGVHSMVIVRVEMADSGQFTCLAENIAGEARSTADLVVRPAGTEPGSYFHVTKVTQEKQVKGEEVNRNESFSIENPRVTPARL